MEISLVFRKLRWKNFLSTGNDWTEIDFTSVKTTLVIGDNGSGKSTMLDALCYALYGKPFRKINIPQLMNAINSKNMLVEIEFDAGHDSYVVRRGLKPNIFEVQKNAVLVNQEAANKDYQDILTKYILKMNMKAFCQVVILGSASFVPFMQLSAGHRREILEDLLDIQIFTVMNLLLKDKIASNSKDILEIDYKLDLVNEKIRMQEEHREKMLSNSQELINDIEENIARTQRDIDSEEKIVLEKREVLSALIEASEGYDEARSKLSENHKLYTQLYTKKEKLDDELLFFRDHDNCPICKQIIEDSFRLKMIEDKTTTINALNSAISTIEKKNDKQEKKISALKSVLDKISSINVDINIRNNKIKAHKSSILDLKKQIDKISKKNEAYIVEDNSTKNLENELNRIIELKKKLFETKEIHKIASNILKDSGIKSKIIKQYIPIINKLINKYLSSMDFFVQFELDENFNETIKSRFRDTFSYASFSEGEKSKIDLALLFTWRTIARLRNSASTNILILDEVFDGSLDSNTEEELLKILLELSNDSHVMVISHRTDRLLDKFDRILKFEKKSNFSKMITEEKENA